MSELRKTEADRLARQAHVTETLGLMRNLGQAINTYPKTSEKPTVAGVLGQAVTKDMVDRAIESRTGFMKTYRDPVSNKGFRFVNDSERETKVRQFLAREKARVVLASGLTVAENIADVDTWHRLIESQEFLDFGKQPVSSENEPPLPVPQASQVIETLARVGEKNKRYLGRMATKWWKLYDQRDVNKNVPVEVENLAARMMQRSRDQLDGALTDFRLRDLAGEFAFGVASPEKFFAAELHRKTDESRVLPQSAQAVLTAVRSRPFNAKKRWYYEGLTTYAEDVLSREDMLDANSKNPDVYRESGYALLRKMLEFAGKEFPGVKAMAQNMAPSNDKARADRVVKQTAKIIAIANNPAIRGYVRQMVERDRNRPATIPSVEVKNGYEAVDRLLITVEHEIGGSGMDMESKQAFAAAASCVRTIMRFGNIRADEAQALKRAA